MTYLQAVTFEIDNNFIDINEAMKDTILNELRLEFNVNDKIDVYFDAFNWVDETMYESMKG